MKLNATNTSILRRLLNGRNSRPLRSMLERLEQPAQLASLFSQLTKSERMHIIDALISIQKTGPILVQIPEQHLSQILSEISASKVTTILRQSSNDEGAYILQHIPVENHENYLKDLPENKSEELKRYLNYPENSAGRLMSSHYFSIPSHLNAQQGIDYLRDRSKEESLYYIYCLDEKFQLQGVVSLRQLVTAHTETQLFELAKKDVISVTPQTPASEVAKLVRLYDFLAIPVVDEKKKMLGLVTVDDVLDLVQEEATASIYASAGLQESDRVYSPALEKIKNRTPWMVLNLILAAAASAVVFQFEDLLEQLVILAIVKNIVTSSGGNTAIQTLTVITRGIATDDFQFIGIGKAFAREVIVGTIIGLFTGLLAGITTYYFDYDAKHSLMVATVMLLSMVLTSILASIIGAGVPLALKKLGRDPAVGSGVIVTVIIDIFGFFSFLGLASLGLKYWPV